MEKVDYFAWTFAHMNYVSAKIHKKNMLYFGLQKYIKNVALKRKLGFDPTFAFFFLDHGRWTWCFDSED